MSNTSLVLTILGKDRPGLVDSIANAIAEHDGNWVESRMAHLAGHFAGILRVEVAAEKADSLTAAIQSLSAAGLESVVHTHPITQALSESPIVRLSLTGQDRPGIVREISHVLATHAVNVEELNTECRRAANTGQALFYADAQLRLPSGVSADALRESLEQVATDMMVDISLE